MVNESLRTKMLQADVFMEYTNRLQSNRALLVNFNAGYNSYPQQLALFSNRERFIYPPHPDSAYAVINQHLANTNRQAALKLRLLHTKNRYTYEIFGETAYDQAEFGTRVWNQQMNNTYQLVIKKWFAEAGLNMGFSFNKISGFNRGAVRTISFHPLAGYWFPYWNSKLTWHLSRRSRFDGEFLYTWQFPDIHQMVGFYYYNDFSLLQTGLGSAGYQKVFLLRAVTGMKIYAVSGTYRQLPASATGHPIL